ncbi:hypothetical protein KSB_74800 [Ktedonobacter robiniae]|uniref:Uncharacterized protein n=1 Tax=Ktedonobacter robiniae TaxID=2778365 RepID=A0ABQ3V3E9_9CHLR|nr:hypothetical protein KSB_74800 [Ktedonobacter robiniae]
MIVRCHTYIKSNLCLCHNRLASAFRPANGDGFRPAFFSVCRRIDSVQRVTAIYNKSFSTATRLQPQMTYGANRRLTTTMRPVTTTQQTILGKMLAPP